jgi:hypothetical protein
LRTHAAADSLAAVQILPVLLLALRLADPAPPPVIAVKAGKLMKEGRVYKDAR